MNKILIVIVFTQFIQFIPHAIADPNGAATKIQKVFRGFRERKILAEEASEFQKRRREAFVEFKRNYDQLVTKYFINDPISINMSEDLFAKFAYHVDFDSLLKKPIPAEDTTLQATLSETKRYFAKVRALEQKIRKIPIDPDHKVYLSLTAGPDRIPQLKHVLDTIDTRHLEEIIISIPNYYKDDPRKPYSIPTELATYPKVKIIRIENDLGPITKLVPGAEYVQKKEASRGASSRALGPTVITIDDDWAYPAGMINELIWHARRHPGAAVSADGQEIKFWDRELEQAKILDRFPAFKFPNTAIRPTWQTYDGAEGRRHSVYRPAQVLQGYSGVAYPASIDTELMRLFSNRNFSKACFLSDDLVISFVLAFSKIDRFSVHSDFLGLSNAQYFAYPEERGPSALSAATTEEGPHLINAKKYRDCYKALIEATWDAPNRRFKTREAILTERAVKQAAQDVVVKPECKQDKSCGHESERMAE